MDLLIWIPKVEGDPSVLAQRPLQLPTCLRRLFGAALAEVAGPVLEPQLSAFQAAKRGGSCGPNIRRLYEHLEHGRGLDQYWRPADRAMAGLWEALLSWAAEPIRQWA